MGAQARRRNSTKPTISASLRNPKCADAFKYVSRGALARNVATLTAHLKAK